MGQTESNIKKNFKIPEDYFNQLEKNVLAKTIDKKTPSTFFSINTNYILKIAASIAIVCIIGVSVFQLTTNESGTNIQAEQVNMDEELLTAMLLEEDNPEVDETLSELADFLIELDEVDF